MGDISDMQWSEDRHGTKTRLVWRQISTPITREEYDGKPPVTIHRWGLHCWTYIPEHDGEAVRRGLAPLSSPRGSDRAGNPEYDPQAPILDPEHVLGAPDRRSATGNAVYTSAGIDCPHCRMILRAGRFRDALPDAPESAEWGACWQDAQRIIAREDRQAATTPGVWFDAERPPRVAQRGIALCGSCLASARAPGYELCNPCMALRSVALQLTPEQRKYVAQRPDRTRYAMMNVGTAVPVGAQHVCGERLARNPGRTCQQDAWGDGPCHYHAKVRRGLTGDSTDARSSVVPEHDQRTAERHEHNVRRADGEWTPLVLSSALSATGIAALADFDAEHEEAAPVVRLDAFRRQIAAAHTDEAEPSPQEKAAAMRVQVTIEGEPNEVIRAARELLGRLPEASEPDIGGPSLGKVIPMRARKGA